MSRDKITQSSTPFPDPYIPEHDHHEGITISEATQLADRIKEINDSPWNWNMVQLYGCLLLAYFGACTNGYDGSVMGGLNAMDSYQGFFHMKTASSATGLVFAIYSIGTVASIPFVGPVNDYFGRRAGMWSGATIILGGTVVISRAVNKGMFMTGRFVLGFGVGFCNISSPVYVGEMAHPAWRGTLMGMYNSFWSIGSIVASWVVYAARDLGPNGWRIPLYCQFIPAGIVFTFVWLLPESPRWLIAQGRVEAAKKILTKYHGRGDPNHPLVELELAEMDYQISTTASDKRWWDYRELWQTRSDRYRLLCVVTMASFSQLSGNSVTSYYLPVMLENAGIVSQSKKLLLNAILPVITFFIALIGARLTDIIGRRPLLLSTLAFCIVCFGIITPTSKVAYEDRTKTSTSNASIAFTYLFAISYALGWTPLSPAYVVEVLPTNTRAKGKSFAQLFTAISSIIISYSSGPAFEKLRYYFYFFFIGWDCFEWIVIYLLWPETKGRTIEELKEVFEAKNPVAKSLEPINTQTLLNTIQVGKDEGRDPVGA